LYGWTEGGNGGSEARVELDDELLVDVLRHLFARRQANHRCLEGLGVHGEPTRHVADTVFLEAARGQLAGGRSVLDLDLVASLHVVARDIDFVAVDADVPMIDELTGGGPGLGQTQKVDGAV